jgi:hypothetical protein
MRTFICATVIVAVLTAGSDGRDSRDGLLRDADGNAHVLKDMRHGRTWMTNNLNFARPDSYCYWDGDALVFADRHQTSNGEMRITFRYELQDSGRRLRASEQLRGPDREQDNLWVFDRAAPLNP